MKCQVKSCCRQEKIAIEHDFFSFFCVSLHSRRGEERHGALNRTTVLTNTMIINYNNIEEERVQNFKGGNGELDTRNFVDEKNKIMMSRLTPGANIGYHKHEMNSEIIYILSGVGHFEYDDQVEKVKAGDVHYCPMGHSHAFYNDGDDDLAYFAIVAEHH